MAFPQLLHFIGISLSSILISIISFCQRAVNIHHVEFRYTKTAVHQHGSFISIWEEWMKQAYASMERRNQICFA